MTLHRCISKKATFIKVSWIVFINQLDFKQEIIFKLGIFRTNGSDISHSLQTPSASVLVCYLCTEIKQRKTTMEVTFANTRRLCCPLGVRRSCLHWWRYLQEGRCGSSPGWAAESGRTVWRQREEIWYCKLNPDTMISCLFRPGLYFETLVIFYCILTYCIFFLFTTYFLPFLLEWCHSLDVALWVI